MISNNNQPGISVSGMIATSLPSRVCMKNDQWATVVGNGYNKAGMGHAMFFVSARVLRSDLLEQTVIAPWLYHRKRNRIC